MDLSFAPDSGEVTGFTKRYVTNVLFVLLNVEHTLSLNMFLNSLKGHSISSRPCHYSKYSRAGSLTPIIIRKFTLHSYSLQLTQTASSVFGNYEPVFQGLGYTISMQSRATGTEFVVDDIVGSFQI